MWNIQVRIETRRLPDTYRLIGKPHMQAFLIRRRVNRHRLDTHFPAGAYHPQGNFSSIGNQYFFKHAGSLNFSDTAGYRITPGPGTDQAGSTWNKG
jgi:hypothetical protein